MTLRASRIDDVVGRALLVVVVGLEHVARGEQQDQAEEVEDPGEGVDQRRAEEDEAGAGDQREHDAEQQHLLLVLAGHPEARHDDEEDEQVVDRQRLLGDVAGEVLRTRCRARRTPARRGRTAMAMPTYSADQIAASRSVGTWALRTWK